MKQSSHIAEMVIVDQPLPADPSRPVHLQPALRSLDKGQHLRILTKGGASTRSIRTQIAVVSSRYGRNFAVRQPNSSTLLVALA